MFTVKNSAEFISDIQALDARLKNVRLSSIEIEREKCNIKYNFICDQAIDAELQKRILDEVAKRL